MKPSVRACLLLGFALVVGLFAAATLVTVTSMQRIDELERALFRLDTARHHGHMTLSAFQEQYIHQAHSLITGNTSHLSHYREYREAAVDRLRHFEKACVQLGLANRAAEIREKVDEMDRRFEVDVVPLLGVAALPNLQDHHRKLEELTDRARKLTEELNHHLDARSEEGRQELTAVLGRTRTAVVVLLSLSAVAAVATGLVLIRLIGRPVSSLQAALSRLAAGELKTRLRPSGPREIAELVQGFNSMAAALEEGREKVARSERLAVMGQLAAGVAHELNNPLGVITGYLKIVRRSIGGGSLSADLSIIADEVEQCGRIVQSLLEVARPQRLRFQTTDLAELVGETVARTDRVQSGGAAVSVSGADRPILWDVDPSALRRVIANLLGNAMDAAGASGRVSVAITETGSNVVVEVGDSGPGVPLGEHSRIFEPFHTTKPKGLGLGLAICDVLVRGHGGAITVGRAAEGGAAFRVTLPRQPLSAHPAEAVR